MNATMNAEITLNAFTLAASAVAEAMCTSKKPRRKVVGTTSQDQTVRDHKSTRQAAELDLPELVPMNLVRTDGGTQARMTINETVVKDYADALEEGAKLPPVVLYYDESADVYWLADGFHRFEAHRHIGRVAIAAFVKDGTLRDAKLHAAGANGTHGLPRTNADKRCAVLMLLDDPEWAAWSDNAIAKACRVSHTFVGNVRASLESVAGEAPTKRTYTTKHGTTATMQTAKVGKSKPILPVTPSDAEALPSETAPGNAAASMTIEQSALGEASVDELVKNAAQREQAADLKVGVAKLITENEQLVRVEDDDHVEAALAEVARFKAQAENAERALAARSHEFNECSRNVTYWKNRAEKAEKQLTTTEAADESSALRAESAQLREQLGELAEQFEETLAEAEAMRKIIEADDQLAEAVKMLKQAQELNRVLETRLHGLVNEKNEVLRRYKGAQHELDKLKRAHGELSAKLATPTANRAAAASGNTDFTSTELFTLRVENDRLRAQLGDLALQFGEAMVCYDEMLAILDTSVPLETMPRQLEQALELARMFESRVAEAPRRQQDDVVHRAEHEPSCTTSSSPR